MSDATEVKASDVPRARESPRPASLATAADAPAEMDSKDALSDQGRAVNLRRVRPSWSLALSQTG